MIYFYWGNKTMSFLRFMTLYSACKYNDNVTLIVKRGEEVPITLRRISLDKDMALDYTPCLKHLNLNIVPLEDIGSFDTDINEIYMSDILGWYLLAYKGGTVADMDILFFRPCPEIDFDVGITFYPTKLRAMPIGFLQGRPNRFFVDVYNEALTRLGARKRHQSVGENVLRAVYYRYCSDKLFEQYQLKVKELSHELVYPFARIPKGVVRMSRKLMFDFDSKLPEKTIGLHWFGGRNLDYNSMFTHVTYKAFGCTVSRIIESIVSDYSIFEEAI